MIPASECRDEMAVRLAVPRAFALLVSLWKHGVDTFGSIPTLTMKRLTGRHCAARLLSGAGTMR